jgi:hypothetical protein
MSESPEDIKAGLYQFIGAARQDLAELDAWMERYATAVRREQARVDADLMQKNADRAPTAPAPKGGTTSRAVFESAYRMIHPDELGWSLELPEHLRDTAGLED